MKFPCAFFALLLLALPLMPVQGQVRLSDPGFPREESYTYQKTGEKGVETARVKIHRDEYAAPPQILYLLESETEEIRAKLDLATLTGFYSQTISSYEASTIRRTNEVLENNKRAGPGQLLITDAAALPVSLRGFPWEEQDEAELLFPRDSNRFTLTLKVKGRQTVETPAGDYECYEVHLQLDGILGGLFPKTRLWYSVDPPHILVRSEDPGMGGGDEVQMELLSYSAQW
jgi:hypothetical protein